MVENNIRSALYKKNLKQADVIRELDGINAVQFSAVVSGAVLPIKEHMEKICAMLDCKPTDLYRESDLNLTGKKPEKCSDEKRVRVGAANHDGMERCRFWMYPEEKAALQLACEAMGYRNPTEWFRESFRDLLERCVAVQSAFPQQVEFAAAAGSEHNTILDIPKRLKSNPLRTLYQESGET